MRNTEEESHEERLFCCIEDTQSESRGMHCLCTPSGILTRGLSRNTDGHSLGVGEGSLSKGIEYRETVPGIANANRQSKRNYNKANALGSLVLAFGK